MLDFLVCLRNLKTQLANTSSVGGGTIWLPSRHDSISHIDSCFHFLVLLCSESTNAFGRKNSYRCSIGRWVAFALATRHTTNI